MKEYISREALHRKFWFNDKLERIPETDIDGFPITLDLHTIKQIVRDIPAEDVVKVVRGYWDKTKDKEHDFRTYYCSVCGKGEYYFNATQYSYCPHCGALMEGSGE
jgi:hypothetical protein